MRSFRLPGVLVQGLVEGPARSVPPQEPIHADVVVWVRRSLARLLSSGGGRAEAGQGHGGAKVAVVAGGG